MAEQTTPQQRRSTDCGPNEVRATARGSWQEHKFTAAVSARDQARALAAQTCGGSCAPAEQSCKYVELRVTLDNAEERTDPTNPAVTQFSYECTSEGTCQCE